MNVPAWGLVGALLLSVPPAVPAQTPAELVQSYVGQKRILRHFSDKFAGKVKRKDLSKLAGGCDFPVEIPTARYQEQDKEVELQVETIGRLVLYLQKQPQRQACGAGRTAPGRLRLTGFDPDTPADALRAELDALLQTPEAYLASRGIAYSVAPTPNPTEPVLDLPRPRANPPDHTPPQAVLTLEATYSEAARQAKKSGVVLVRFLVGTDGRVYQPRIVHAGSLKPIGFGLEEQTLRVLDLCRFLPAQKNGQPVAYWVTIEMSFRLR